MHQTLSTHDCFKKVNEWKEQAKGVSKFLTNYMNQVEVLLMFTAATRTCNWRLHLAKMEELLPYFHAHDQYNYGRWGPLYVADMLELQSSDPETWHFLDEGNFSITKHSVPFTAIDLDHGIEQEHKKMKVKGGFIGITGKEQALDKYFIIAPTLCRIVQEFKEYAGIEVRQPSSLHHELVGAKGAKNISFAAKIFNVLTKEGNPFLKTDMFNLVTFAVTPDSVSRNIENRDKLGKEALENFVSTRMVEKSVPFWDVQKKNNLTYFKDVGATVQTKVKGQLVSIQQERSLLSRLLVVCKTRNVFSVKDAITEFEFCVAPPSTFHPDGSMIMLSDKSKLVPAVMKSPLPLPDELSIPEPVRAASSVLIIDAMCIVNMVPKTPEMSNALHFAKKFVDIVADMSEPYEVRVIFDQYLAGSLKETTRQKRTVNTTPVHYHVNDNTEIRNLKTFLSHVDTKAELTEYLSDKLISHYENKPKRVVVMHHTTMKANHSLSDIVSMPEMATGRHNLEEGDQLVLLNAFDVMHKDPQSILDVFSVDTDVFVLLLGHFPSLPKSSTLLRTKSDRISINDCYQRLGPKRTEALIGWYAFKGTDNTGSFAGKGLLSHFKAFMQTDDEVLKAFTAFGLTEEIPACIFDQMERYLCLLYKTSGIGENNVRELRWALFAQKGREGKQLPPTRGTLVPHTSRAYYMALVWKLSKAPCPEIPSPVDYGWKSEDGRLKPVFCENAPAPEALLELRKCHCKTGCNKQSCGCRRNSLVCTDLCGCGEICENVVLDKPVDVDETD